jgi:hypothetical protein
MAITTVIKHKTAERTAYLNAINPNLIGFQLKILEYVTRGQTDGSITSETVDGDTTTVVRTWNDQSAAQEYCNLIKQFHPANISADVVID